MTERTRGASLLGLGAFVAVTAIAAGIGAVATQKSVRSPWYRFALKKPSFQPPNKAFAPVWTALYGLIAVSGYRVWKAEPSPARTRALALWGSQLALNAAWSAIFFGARKPGAALLDIGALDVAVAAYANEARKVDTTAAWLVAPYAAWTGFATALNGDIVRLNA